MRARPPRSGPNGPLVVDASVALKWVLPEERSDVAASLHRFGALHAPDLLLVESANALWLRVRRGEMPPADAKAALHDLAAAPVAFARDRDLIGAMQSLTLDLDHPAYDCLYLALAIRIAGIVITDDTRFAQAVRRHDFLADRVRLLAEMPSA